MQQPMNGSYYARMGIWGEPTSGPTVIGNAMNTMSGVQGLFGKQYDNIIKKYQASDAGLQNQYAQATQQGRIGAENTKNQTDMQYYPQMQQAKLAQDQATVSEIMSRTGLNRASATEAAARTGLIGAQTGMVNTQASQMSNPGFMYDSLKRQMDASPVGSPRKSYFAGLLNTMMSQSGGAIPITEGSAGRRKNDGMLAPGMGGGSGGSSPSPGGASIPNMPGLSVNPMTVSRSSNKGAEYAQTDDQGNTTVYTSPTTPMVTNLQNRLSAEYELKSLDPVINKGIAPYISKKGAYIDYPADLYNSSRGNKESEQRINNAEAAQQLIAEKAILRIRQATPSAQIGPEMVENMVNQMYPNLPSHFMRGFNSADNIASATEKVDQQLAKANTVAAQQVASNYPTPVGQAPVWDRRAQAPSGGFDPVSGEFRQPSSPGAQQPQQVNQQMQQQVQQLQAQAQAAIARGASPEAVQRRLQEHIQRLQGGG
jgi:hypothetical protein